MCSCAYSEDHLQAADELSLRGDYAAEAVQFWPLPLQLAKVVD